MDRPQFCLFIHQSMDFRLFPFGTIDNNDAMNIYVLFLCVYRFASLIDHKYIPYLIPIPNLHDYCSFTLCFKIG